MMGEKREIKNLVTRSLQEDWTMKEAVFYWPSVIIYVTKRALGSAPWADHKRQVFKTKPGSSWPRGSAWPKGSA